MFVKLPFYLKYFSFLVAIIVVVVVENVNATTSTTTTTSTSPGTSTLIKKCGESQLLSLNVNNITRDYYVYFPPILCDSLLLEQYIISNSDIPSFDPSKNRITVPILISFHGYGLTAMDEQLKWQKISNDYLFILITPNGLKKSWNALQCCYPYSTTTTTTTTTTKINYDSNEDDNNNNNNNNIIIINSYNDIELISAILHNFVSKSIPFPYLSLLPSREIPIFISGWNNGAFLADFYAWVYVVSHYSRLHLQDIRLIGVIMTGGYIYSSPDILTDIDFSNHKDIENFIPISISMHHSYSDNFASINGCCNNNSTHCSNAISFNETCVSVWDEFTNWLVWNNCWDEIENLNKITNDHNICWRTNDPNCPVMNELCVYNDTEENTNWDSNFPNAANTMEKMYQALCRANEGTWDYKSNKCLCGGIDSPRVGPYCNTYLMQYVVPPDPNSGKYSRLMFGGGLSILKLVALLILILLGLFICYHMIKSRKQPDFLYDSRYAFDRKGLGLAKYDRVKSLDDDAGGDNGGDSDLDSNDDGDEL